MEEHYCHECGQEFVINDDGIANHLDEHGDYDYDADADHVPYSIEQAFAIAKCH